MSAEIKKNDVIQLILQYLKENGLEKSFMTLQQESQVGLNQIDIPVQALENEILNGKWDNVLNSLKYILLPQSILLEIYEAIIIELCENMEQDIALYISKKTLEQNGLRSDFPEKVLRLDQMIYQSKKDKLTVFGKDNKIKRRQNIFNKIQQEIKSAKPNRLLQLLGQSIKYQQMQGYLEPNIRIDIFLNKKLKNEFEIEYPVMSCEKRIKYGEAARIECMAISNNGEFFITGAIDGIIEVHDPVRQCLRTDLKFQEEEAFMLHEAPVISLAIDSTDELLASGSKDGEIKLWKFKTGDCLKTINKAYSKPVQKILFLQEISHLMSASQEIKIHGLKSGKVIKEFRGHQSYVNDLYVLEDNSKLFSGSSDGLIKVWNMKSTECIYNLKPPSDKPAVDLDIFNIKPNPINTNEILVCFKNYQLYLMNPEGKFSMSYRADDKNVEFIMAGWSAKGKFIYAVGTDHYLYCFDKKTGKIETQIKIAESDVSGMLQHPMKNIIIIHTSYGELSYWKA